MPRGKAGALPTMRRGAKSLANLKRGGIQAQPRKSAEEKARDIEIRRISRKLILDPTYQKNLKARLCEGKVQPGVEVALYYYAFGRPVETIETKQITPVKIIHEYDEG